ncbi:MAG TPA: GNAT family N-acetyltransferase [Actinomycetota bacterium]|nr:GNAT family N-acetyltransferase [Actinomycetota bacterium]
MGATETEIQALARDAEDAAGEAARSSGVVIELLRDHEHVDAMEVLLDEVWSIDDQPMMPAPVIMALVHAGNYVSGAFADGKLVGGSLGFLGRGDQKLHLHSHVTGVASSMQSRSVGFALKQHQRAWALGQGLDSVIWTFDPLVRRNGYFNISKLGAEIIDYKPDFYGVMKDGINRGDESDRCVVRWAVASPRAAAAARRKSPETTVDPTQSHELLAASPDGEPVMTREHAPTLSVFVPSDIVHTRREDPARAARWRQVLREACTWAFSEGYAVTGMTRSGCYVFSRSAKSA